VTEGGKAIATKVQKGNVVQSFGAVHGVADGYGLVYIFWASVMEMVGFGRLLGLGLIIGK